MAAVIHSKIVRLDELIPRPEDIELEDQDVEMLLPWIFRDDTDESDTESPLKEDIMFTCFFEVMRLYSARVEEWNETEGPESPAMGIKNALKPRQALILPKKSWHMSVDQEEGSFIKFQGLILKHLMRKVFRDLGGLSHAHLGISGSQHKMRYVIGGRTYGTKSRGNVSIRLGNEHVPIISFTGWYEGQTWHGFLVETLSVMLGQLARNFAYLSRRSRDQEVFVIGFHGYKMHIARGYFTREMITRVHVEGCSEGELVDLQFSRGFDLYFKEQWIEATRALARLARYILSGEAKVAAVDRWLAGGTVTED